MLNSQFIDLTKYMNSVISKSNNLRNVAFDKEAL